MAEKEMGILSFSYPEELKNNLKDIAQDNGFHLATYIKRTLDLFISGDTEDEKPKKKKKKKIRRGKK